MKTNVKYMKWFQINNVITKNTCLMVSSKIKCLPVKITLILTEKFYKSYKNIKKCFINLVFR